MKAFGQSVGGLALAVVALTFLLMPYAGLVFFGAVALCGGALLLNVVGVITTSHFVLFASSFLGYAWKVYVGVGVFVMFVMTTFIYQNCCVGLNTLWAHIGHARQRHFENLVIAVIWPWGGVRY